MRNVLKYILKQLARATIWRYRPEIIAITGSVGKTSAKEAIYAVLKNYKRVRKSGGNLNNELGVPLTIIGDWPEKELELISRAQPAGTKRLKKLFFWLKVILSGIVQIIFPQRSAYPQVLILEYGADKPGDIKQLLSIARPKIAVITAIGEIPVHVEFYSGPEAVAREKGKLIEHLFVNDYAVLNFDDQVVMGLKEKTRATIKTFGFEENADVRLNNYEIKPEGIVFKLEHSGSVVPVFIQNTFGRAQAYAASAAACVGLVYDINLVEISEALSANYKPVKGRMNLLPGVKNTFIIDDAYNASPLSMQEALNTLRDLPAKRKIAVLGDMLELGKYSLEAHQSIGALAAKTADVLITAGPRGKFIAEGGLNAGMPKDHILSFDTAAEAGKELQELIKPGDLVLIKASRAMGMETIVEEIRQM
jgi:UDP-N-acetylmuramoyl-tripeptide--D-alanyl-D-alanine ligase